MSKTSRYQQVDDERKLLIELQKDANENIGSIAKHCGFSRQKTWRLKKQLEKNHKIWGYTAIVDTETQDQNKYILSIKRSNTIIDKKKWIEDDYKRLEKILLNLGITIESSYYVHGEYDWILIFTAKNLQYAKKFTEFLLSTYPDLVKNVAFSQILYIQRDHRIANPKQDKLLDFL